MVQRKVPNKLGIKPHLLKSDTQLVNLRPSSPQTHEKLKKIMKKSRPIKWADESRPLPPFQKKRSQPLDHDPTPATPPKQSPNYMKSTSSFDARKERSPSVTSRVANKTPVSDKSRTSSLKLTKTPSFKPWRPLKKCSSVMLCDDLDARKATCSSTLKDSKFPKYLELSPGGTELNGSSAMKVCPYTYCSLNGHHHTQSPPLRCFLSARRRALKTQKSFKVGCLSPRQTKHFDKKNDEMVNGPVVFEAPEEVDMEETVINPVMEEENKDFFIEIFSKDKESKGSKDIDGVESLYDKLQALYDEESVTSGAWSDEDGDSESDISFEESSTTTETDVNAKTEELVATNFQEKKDELVIGDEKIEYKVNYQWEETSQESENVPENSKEETNKHHTTIIYNIINFNISVFINGVKTDDSAMDKSLTKKMEKEEVKEEEYEANNVDEITEANQTVPDEELPFDDQDKGSNGLIKECEEITTETDLMNSCINLKGSKKADTEIEDLSEFNPRGPNFLPEVVGPDAETVDLRHQTMDERKNAEEFMVDFALQKTVTTLEPERKKKVALLVEAFEKVMPAPKYESRNRNSSKGFENARIMQACS